MEIKAAVLNAPHAPFDIETVQLSEPSENEVLVKLVATGLCHTDLAVQHQAIPLPCPVVLGHEGAGIVEKVGAAVTKFKAGDKVVLTMAFCGECENCKRGDLMYCENQAAMNYAGARPDGSATLCRHDAPITGAFFGQSSFATYALCNARNAVKLPDDADLQMAAPLGCGVQTGAGAVMKSLDAQPGRSLAVFGGGAVGMSAVMAAVARGCSPIIVVEPVKARRELALSIGATHAIDPADGDTTEQIRAIVARGIDYAVETTGIPPVLNSAIKAMAVHGHLGMIGVPSDPAATIELNLFATLSQALRFTAIIEGDSTPDAFIPEMYELYRQGKFPLEKLIATYPFEQINQAIEDQGAGKVLKPVLVF
ncbi:MAG: NAD(P)-dependent alcohol dehydrogenase [Myxococcota bacterium]|nr:NAD(P)-dependent alcohol dehydrogenase [Myxococcota bacterium]